VAAPAGRVTVAGSAGISTETEAEFTCTVAVRTGPWCVVGGTVTCTRVDGNVTLAVVEGTATVAVIGWLRSPTPETLTVWGCVVATVVTGGVTAVSVTASCCRGGM
jgi:hypothetical protein